MSKAATGTVWRSKSGAWNVRITIDPRTRPSFVMPWCKSEDAAKTRLAIVLDFAEQLRAAGRLDLVRMVLGDVAKAATADALQAARRDLAILLRGPKPRANGVDAGITFFKFAEMWTSGELRSKWPDHVDKMDSSAPAGVFKKHMPAEIGNIPIASFTLDDADAFMSSLPSELASTTRFRFATHVHRVLALAVYPARLIAANPIPVGWLPRRGQPRAMSCLYPSEDALLMACTDDVALEDRMFWGVLAREGMRCSEATAMTWGDLDLERGAVRLDENKTDDARSWALDPGVARALAAWRDHVPHEDANRVFPNEPGWHPVERFHAKLKKAGVTRAELFESTKARRRIRIHDLRSTFVTVNLANDRTETWIADRTGHKSSNMIQHYRRAARHWSELDLGTLTPLDQAIPEFSASAISSTESSTEANAPHYPLRKVAKRPRKTAEKEATPQSTC